MSRRSLSTSHTESDEQSRRILDHYNELQSNIAALIGGAHQDNGDPEQSADAYLTLQNNANGIGRCLSFHIGTKFYNERRLPDSTIAGSVFNIPELLEMILLHLSAFDILNMASTCHSLKTVIDASSKLPEAMFQKPTSMVRAKDQAVHSPFTVPQFHRRFTVYISDLDRPAQRTRIDASFTYGDNHFGLPKVGPKIRSMLICRPAITEMVATATCMAHRYDITIPNAVLAETGVTFDDLYKVAESVIKREHFCPRCRNARNNESLVNDNDPRPMKPSRTIGRIDFESHTPPNFLRGDVIAGGA